MKCSNCGNEVAEGAKFCGSCGQTVENLIEVVEKPETPRNKGFLRNKLIPLVLVAAVAVLIVVICSSGKSRTIRLVDYVVVTEKGYNGYGSADLDLDWANLIKDHKNHIAFTEKGEQMFGQQCEPFALVDEFTRVNMEYGENGYLSNGDQVNCEIDVDETLWDYVVCDLDYSEVYIYFMSQLKDLTKKDVFEKLNVEFTGVSPWGTATLTYEEEDDNIVDYFYCTKEYDLKNGDMVEVILNEDQVESLKSNYGIEPTVLSKEYIVKGLPQYVEASNQICEDSIRKLKELANEEFNSEKENWNSSQNLKKIEYIGPCLLKANEGRGFKNMLYFIYKIEVTNTLEGQSKDFIYYWYVEFTDVYVDANGNVEEETIENIYTPSSDTLLEVSIDTPNADSDSVYGRYYGFENLEALKAYIYNSDVKWDYELIEYPNEG